MFLDLAPLTSTHAILFGVAFSVVFAVIGLAINQPRPWLRGVRKSGQLQLPQLDQQAISTTPHPIFYAGPVLIVTVLILAFIMLPDKLLATGLLAAGVVALMVGIVDEQHPISAKWQLAWQIAIVALAVVWGWTISHVTNPFGPGVLDLKAIELGAVGLYLPASLLAGLWLLLLINAINWLDGSDGLASGVGTVALFTIGAVALLPSVQDPQTLALAAIGAGGTLAFLLWNFPSAKVYLGTSGSWFLGLFIGLTAILGGGKIVTTVLVLAIPLLDLIAVILQRLNAGKAPWEGDRVRHLHHRLKAAGLSPRAIALLGMGISAILGILAITIQTNQKIIALAVAAGIFSLLTLSFLKNGAHTKPVSRAQEVSSTL